MPTRAEPVTPKQREFLTDLLHDCNFSPAEEQAYYLKKTGRVVLSVSELRKGEAMLLINELKIRRDHLRCRYTVPPIGIETHGIETQPVPVEGQEPVYETTGPPPWD